MKYFIIAGVLFLFSIQELICQFYTQNIKGKVVDKITQQPLPGANIVIQGTNPLLATTTDNYGNFRINNVPIGRVSVSVSFVGYQPVTLNNVDLTTGKELQLFIELEESVFEYEEVVVKANASKIRPTNEMAIISARSFTVEETEKYAGSRGDVARMASNFAGVAFANDQRNDIIIRGNSPSGLLWRLDDVEIPNPNHFAENGTTGGPVSMLNNNVLRNSDFYTGAFPAEFGNALSGVFDLKMRNGNTEKHEFTIQSGFNGFELGAEGPINQQKQSSYLAYYRYSVLDIMDKLGFYFGTAGVPRYQDLVFKVNQPLTNGAISVFGMAGMSSIDMLSSRLDSSDLYLSEGQDIYNRSKLGALACSYTHFFNENISLKFIASALYQNGGTDIDTLDENNKNPFRYIQHNIDESRLSVTTYLNMKHNSKLFSKAGLQIDQMGYDLGSKIYDHDSSRMVYYLHQTKKITDGPQLFKTFYQVKQKIGARWEFTGGLQFIYFTLNNNWNLEPRAGISFNYIPNCRINFGYGLHSRIQTLATYYWGEYYDGIGYKETNRNLDFTKAHHWVLGHDWDISQVLRFKVETYYQYLYHVPVRSTKHWYSIINTGANWGVEIYDSLVNKGKGYNYGLEFTIEKFLSRNYYFLITTSLYKSMYQGSDGVWRHTAFDGGYIVNLLGGYEQRVNQKWAITYDLKLSTAGGKRYTPIDLEKSIVNNETQFDERYIFEKQFEPFFKIDIKVGIKQNKPRSTNEWQIYVENLTNHRNPLYEYYNTTRKKITRSYQLGIFPMVLWRLTF